MGQYIPPFTITLEIVDLVERIGEALGRLDAVQPATDLLLRRANRIRTLQGSLAIEGNTLGEEEIATIYYVYAQNHSGFYCHPPGHPPKSVLCSMH